jgi:hypothetical protein
MAAMAAVERKRQRIDLALQPMKDSAKFINLGEGYFGQRHGFLSAVVDPDHQVLFKLAQRRGDLPVALNLGFQNPDVPQMFVVSHTDS